MQGGLMFGNQSTYDFAKGRLIEEYGNEERLQKESIKSHSFVKNRLFVLMKDTNCPICEVRTNGPFTTYHIREYSVEYHAKHLRTCLEVDVYKCNPFECITRSYYKMVSLSSNSLVVFVAFDKLEPWRKKQDGFITSLQGLDVTFLNGP